MLKIFINQPLIIVNLSQKVKILSVFLTQNCKECGLGRNVSKSVLPSMNFSIS